MDYFSLIDLILRKTYVRIGKNWKNLFSSLLLIISLVELAKELVHIY